MLSSRVFQCKLHLNDKDSTPYNVVFAFGILEIGIGILEIGIISFALGLAAQHCTRLCFSTGATALKY